MSVNHAAGQVWVDWRRAVQIREEEEARPTRSEGSMAARQRGPGPQVGGNKKVGAASL